MAAEGRNNCKGVDRPQMNANDADRSLARSSLRTRGNNKSFWNVIAYGRSPRAVKYLRSFAFICGCRCRRGSLRPSAAICGFSGPLVALWAQGDRAGVSRMFRYSTTP
jgi:hypothetical protein